MIFLSGPTGNSDIALMIILWSLPYFTVVYLLSKTLEKWEELSRKYKVLRMAFYLIGYFAYAGLLISLIG